MVNIRKNGASRKSKSDASNKNMSYDEKDKLINIGRSEIRYDKEIDPDMSDQENQNDDDENNNNNKGRLSFNNEYSKKKEKENININKFRNEIIECDLINNKDHMNDIDLGLTKDKSIKKRENAFQKKKYDYTLSPQRADPFADKSPSPGERTYTDIMLENKKKSKMKEASRKLSHYNKQGDSTNDTKEKMENENSHGGNSHDDDNNNYNNYNNTDDANSNDSDADILRGMKNEKNEKKKITNNLKSKWDVVKHEKNNLNMSNMPTHATEKWTEHSSFVVNNNKKKKNSRWDKISKEQEDVKRVKLNKENNDNMSTPYISNNMNTIYIE
ncbi:hypothetical protein PFAG_00396 [Plasmodium falciparum Santa Lucia]|uniref:Uncharacterized protein n=1 Tax=Plasmodium falciparum Santa Lucia TaxID=478859 RepID=W7G1E5_PLAFA|nr:hypothetical protein PFAG_00396 [Plasmodium falciparum Santa Lucia]